MLSMLCILMPMSLSSWRAWIEMAMPASNSTSSTGRSPHGERGLKLVAKKTRLNHEAVALLMESVD